MSSDDEWFIEHDLIIMRGMRNIFGQAQKSCGKEVPKVVLAWQEGMNGS